MAKRPDVSARRSSHRSPRRAHRAGELRVIRFGGSDGDTLIELLVTITVIGLTVTALLGTFVVITRSSVEHRYLSALDLVLKDFSEAAANQIELAQPPAYSPCATLSGVATKTQEMKYVPSSGSPTYINYEPPSGYTVSPTSPTNISANSGVDYLIGNTTFGPSGCDPTQYLPQMLTVEVTGPSGSVANMSFVLTDPYQDEDYGGTTSTTTTTTTTIPPTTTTSVGATTTTSTTTTSTTTTTTSTTTTTLPSKYVYVAGLGSSTTKSGSHWDATVTITVEDQTNHPISGVLVTGSWSTSVATYTFQCTTNSSGTCNVTDGTTDLMSKNSVPSVTYSVTGLSLSSYTYWSAANKANSIAVPAP